MSVQKFLFASTVVALVLISLTGCVRRRMTIRSNPSNALVYVDDYEIGTTPISHNFTYYGTRKIRLVKDNYETLTVMQPMKPPWWQIPPIDFVTENLIPGELTDSRTLSYQMVPQRVVPPDELRSRAEGLRSQVKPASYVVPVTPEQPNYPLGQPNYQPMQPAEMVPMQPGQPNYTPPNSTPYPQPGEWPPPGAVAPPNTTPQPNNYHQPRPYTPPGVFPPS